MARKKNTKPTHIYWLVDIRTGVPFYCGKTMRKPHRRLVAHQAEALLSPRRPLCARLISCQNHVEIRIIETVPITKSWADRERYWIRLGRKRFPLVNVSDGGDGAPGNIHSAETRAKIAAKAKGRIIPQHVRELARITRLGSKSSPETCAKISAANKISAKGRIIPQHVREAQRAAATGSKHTDEHKAKISAANTGRKYTAEQRARLSAALKGKPKSAAHREKIRAIRLGTKSSPETGAKIAAANLGKKRTLEARERMRAAAVLRNTKRRVRAILVRLQQEMAMFSILRDLQARLALSTSI